MASSPHSANHDYSTPSLLKLVALMNRLESQADARKLRPAVYLAQEVTEKALYAYHLIQGRVFSQELDIELHQLESGGFLNRACTLETRSMAFVPGPGTANVDKWLSEEDEPFVELLGRLMDEDQRVLEAAATYRYFWSEDLGEPASRLKWLRALDTHERERASELAASL